MGWFLAAGGAFTLCGVAFDWQWLMNQWNARFFIRRFGRSGTRIFFGTIGAAILVLGLLIATGVVQGSA